MDKVPLLEDSEEKDEVKERRTIWGDLKVWIWGKRKDQEAKRRGYQTLRE